MAKLQRFWFEFHSDNKSIPLGLGLGCGITAWNYDDALNILKTKIFTDGSLPEIKSVIEDADVSKLDEGHVLPNILPPNERGIWYPQGYNY